MVVAPQTSVPHGITHKNITGDRKGPRKLGALVPSTETHHVGGKLVFHRYFVKYKSHYSPPLIRNVRYSNIFN